MTANQHTLLTNPAASEYKLDPRILWQKHEVDELDDEFDRPEDIYMCFGIFYLDIFCTSVETEINKVLVTVQKKLDSWTVQYPWNAFTPFSVTLERLDSSTPYLFGYLKVESNRHRESSLIVGIMHELSQELGPHTFIKVCDSFGDLVLSDANEAVPPELEYPVGSNRLWLTEGKFKTIPISFYPTRGLTSAESIEFLKKASYKLSINQNMAKNISSLYVDKFPENQLSDLKMISIEVEDPLHYKILKDNPTAINFIISRLHTKYIKVDTSVALKSSRQQLDCLTNQGSRTLLSFSLNILDGDKNEKTIPVYAGKLISSALQDLINESILKVTNNEVKQSIFDLTKATNVFKGYKFKKDALLDPPDFTEDMNNIPGAQSFLDAFDKFRTEKHQGPPPKQSNTPNSDPFLPDDTQQAEDFMEFFLKDALGLSNEKIEEMTPSDMDTSDLMEKMNEFHSEFDPEKHTGEELTKLFDSLNMDEKSTRAFESSFRLFSGRE